MIVAALASLWTVRRMQFRAELFKAIHSNPDGVQRTNAGTTQSSGWLEPMRLLLPHRCHDRHALIVTAQLFGGHRVATHRFRLLSFGGFTRRLA